MKESHSIALIAAYYLSKYDKTAYKELGFRSSTTTHVEIGRILGVNPNTVKNMRDEFDPLHDNQRVGWYQRPLHPSRAKVVEAFQDLSEEELRDVVLEILTNPEFVTSDDFEDVIEPIAKRDKKRKGKPVFIVRGPTGRKAEEIYIKHHRKNAEPISGKLKDTRDHGCGYDFEIVNENQQAQIEVKGLDGDSGGITFTSKEWNVAKKKRDSYFLVIVRNVSGIPSIQIVQNPASVLSPKKSVFTTVQVRWNVTDGELSNTQTAQQTDAGDA